MNKKLNQSINSSSATTIKDLQETLKSIVSSYNYENIENLKNICNTFKDSSVASEIASELPKLSVINPSFINAANSFASSLESIDLFVSYPSLITPFRTNK